MAAKSYSLVFDGYWREPSISGIPANSGIYGVYAATYNATEKTVALNRLLYIGEGSNVKDRVANHDRWSDWKRHLKTGEVICINYTPISPETDRHRAEAAMIFKHKPPCNTEYTENFPFDTTTITTSGKNALMQVSFTVNRVEKAAASLYGRRW
jgi:excinuclease UvrABC nuclease subunit